MSVDFDYSTLFYLSPLPNWIYEIDTFQILDVNQAAILHYGYSREEFLNMTIRDLRPKEDIPKVMDAHRDIENKEGNIYFGIFTHQKKNGQKVSMDINGHKVDFRDKKCIAVICQDVTSFYHDKIRKDLLAKISQVFNVNEDLKSSLNQICQLIVDFGEFTFCEIWLPNIHQNRLRLFSNCMPNTAAKKFYQYASEVNEVGYGEGLPGLVWKEMIAITMENIEQNELFVRNKAAKKVGLKTVFGFPLIHQNEMVGVMVVGTKMDATNIKQYQPVLTKLESFIGSEISRKRLEGDLSHLFEALPDIICITDYNGRFLKMNKAGCEILGYREDEIVGFSFEKFVHPADRHISSDELKKLLNDQALFKFENRIITKDRKIVWLSWNGNSSLDEEIIYATAKDITLEKKLKELGNDASKMARIGGWEIDFVSNKIHWSDVVHQIHETDSKSFVPIQEEVIKFYREDFREKVIRMMNQTLATGEPIDFEAPLITAKGNQIWVRVIGSPEFSEGKCIRIFGSFQDIHTSKSNALQLEEILGSISDAFYAVDKNWNFTYFNKEAENLLQRKGEDLRGKNIWEEFAPAKGTVLETIYRRVAQTGVPESFEYCYPGDGCWYELNTYPSNGGVSSYFKNIEDRKKHESELNDLNEMLKNNIHELETTNEQLEQFAFIASHDLQEPLRMISSFLNLLQRNYKDQLDPKAHQYIYFATDGAKRMRQIILDLLEYSRAGKFSEGREEIHLDKIFEEFLILRKKVIKEMSAKLTMGKVPKLVGFKAPLVQTIHCLLDNAIKYSKDDVPAEITLSVRENEEELIFEIKDNGIGIDPMFFDKIFIIFQRLHNRDQYDGTGIGLSIAKKHVESWGGKIWVESEPGIGSIFYFTINK